MYFFIFLMYFLNKLFLNNFSFLSKNKRKFTHSSVTAHTYSAEQEFLFS